MYLQQYENFTFYINSCDPFDIQFFGSPFTWWNGTAKAECIFTRLDRVLINQDISDEYGNVELQHLTRTNSIIHLCYFLEEGDAIIYKTFLSI